jgi:hypothetical protein
MSKFEVSSEEGKTINHLFPLIEKITDEGLRGKVIETWCRVWRESGTIYGSIVGRDL